MSTYERGTVAVATVRGVPNVRIAFADADDTRYQWFVISGDAADWVPNDAITDINPLVVIHNGDWPSLIRLLRESGFDSLPDQIEAQTKPPRIPEPGLWGVVEAGCDGLGRRTWLHVNENPAGNDWASTDGWHRVWADLENPTLVRPGIEVAS